jgi:hypothetical protein
MLIVGPWVGELGWEIMCWQAYARTLSKRYEHTKVVCQTGHEELYEDFATTFEIFNPNPGYIDCCWHTGHVRCHETPDHKIIPIHSFTYPEGTHAMIPQLLSYRRKVEVEKLVLGVPENFGMVEPTFIQYGNRVTGLQFDVVFHGRSRPVHGDKRNWPKDRWDELSKLLLDQGLTCAAVGTKADSFLPEGAEDMRDLSIKDLVNLFASSKVGMGPSSGPMHLMSMSGMRHISWSIDEPKDENRYMFRWNPLDTPCKFITGHKLMVPVSVAYETVMRQLDEECADNGS